MFNQDVVVLGMKNKTLLLQKHAAMTVVYV